MAQGSAAQAKTNAKKERFYRSLKGEHLNHLELLTRDQAEREIFAYIEILYDCERIHTVLGNLSPLEFENRTHPAQRVMLEVASRRYPTVRFSIKSVQEPSNS